MNQPKILFDENMPRRLKAEFWPDYEVKTTREMGWAGKKNGELLGLMTLEGFEVLITLDKSLPSQQHLPRFVIAVFLLRAPSSKAEVLAPLMRQVVARLREQPAPGLYKLVADGFDPDTRPADA